MKSKAICESNFNILNFIITIARKSCSGRQVELETMEFLGKHDWRRGKHLLEKFVSTHTLSLAAEEYYRQMMENLSLGRTNSSSSMIQNAPSVAASQVTLKALVREL